MQRSLWRHSSNCLVYWAIARPSATLLSTSLSCQYFTLSFSFLHTSNIQVCKLLLIVQWQDMDAAVRLLMLLWPACMYSRFCVAFIFVCLLSLFFYCGCFNGCLLSNYYYFCVGYSLASISICINTLNIYAF